MVSILLFIGSFHQGLALTFTIPTPQLQIPTLSLGPNVIATYPANNERVLSSVAEEPYTPLPRVTVLFSEPIAALTTVKNAVNITFVEDGISMSRDFFTAEILANALYIESTRWYVDAEFSITIDGSQIKSVKSGTMMGSNYSWHFKTDKTRYTNPPDRDESERVPEWNIAKQALTPTVQITNNSDGIATYRISLTPYGVTSARTITIKDVLPPGFSFDSIVGGNVTNGSTVQAEGGNPVTFSITGSIRGGDTFYFDYRVKANGQMSNGTAIVPTGTYHNLAYVKGYFTPEVTAAAAYGNNNFFSSATDSRDDDDNVIITRRTTILPTPTTNSPTPQISPLPTSLVPPTTAASSLPSNATNTLTPPPVDVLTCLQINGANEISFSDVANNERETPYINFLNTTVFANNPTLRVVKGYENQQFGPNNTLTRFELTKIALGANCIDYKVDPTPNNYFSDVPTDNSDMSLIIGKAYAEGVVQGIGNKFYPNRPVTYGEMVKILIGAGIYFSHGIAVNSLTSSTTGITDEAFRPYVEHAARMNLVNFGENNLFPQNDLVLRKFMAQAGAKYIIWLKKLPQF